MDTPALTYRQTGSRWLTDLKSTCTVQLIMLKLYTKNIKSFCPVEAVKSLTNIFWTDGCTVKLNAPRLPFT